MIEMLKTSPDVVAVTIGGRIGGDDLKLVMDRLDAALAGADKVHMFVETRAIESMDLASFPGYFQRALPLFGKLGRFGRIAVVADQSWVRVAARLESALLPHISYRTFLPAERDEALAWVKGDGGAG